MENNDFAVECLSMDRKLKQLLLIKYPSQKSKRPLNALLYRKTIHDLHACFCKPLFPMQPSYSIKLSLINRSLEAIFFCSEEMLTRSPIVFFHGGGFVGGDLETYHPFLSDLCYSTQRPVFSIAYRLAPESVFPAAIDDCLEGTEWFLNYLNQLTSNRHHTLIMAGDSAGGALAALVSEQLNRTNGGTVIRQLLIYPALSLAHEIPPNASSIIHYLSKEKQFYHNLYLNGHNPYSHEVSPCYTKHPDYLPETFLLLAGFDDNLADAKRYQHRLNESGITTELHLYPSMIHGFCTLTTLAKMNIINALGKMSTFLKSVD